ncbi:hypothetical protein SGLAM104S_01124 [Streptomyces glaucescens]
MPEERLDVVPYVVVLYEIPPHRRRSLARFSGCWNGTTSSPSAPGPPPGARPPRRTAPWSGSAATASPTWRPPRCPAAPHEAAAAFDKLGRDTWALPAVGTGGDDTFHITTEEQLEHAAAYYAERGTDWLLSRDAATSAHGRRHQFRVFVLHGQVVHAREHIQPEPDTPCNTCQGATPVHIAPADLPAPLARLAVAATASVGLPFAGVDLAIEHGGGGVRGQCAARLRGRRTPPGRRALHPGTPQRPRGPPRSGTGAADARLAVPREAAEEPHAWVTKRAASGISAVRR